MPFHNFLSKKVYVLFADNEKRALPSDVDADLNEEALLCDEIIDVAIDIPAQDLPEVSEPTCGRLSRQNEEAQQLKAALREALSHKMPHLIEYRHQGDNRFKPDATAIIRLQKKLLAARGKTVPDTLLAPAHHFLDTLLSLQQSDDPAIHETEHHAFDLVRALSGALDAITVAEKVEHLAWEAQVAATADEYRNRLIAALPSHITQRQQAEALLLSENNSASAEYQRFAQLKQSLMAESRLTRQRLAECLQQQAGTILSSARDARLYAMDVLLKRADRTAVGRAEQLADWMQEYQVFASPEPVTRKRVRQGNPLTKGLKATNDHHLLVHHLLQMANLLGSLTVRLKQVIEHVAPDSEKKEAGKRGYGAESRVRNLAQVLKRASPGARNTLITTGTRKKPSRQPTPTEAVNRAIRDSALLLLDAMQQTERRIKQIPTAAGKVADAVEQYLQVTGSRAGEEAFAELNHLLTGELEAEAKRWQSLEQHAQQQLEALLHPLTKRTAEEWAGLFHGALLETLRDVRQRTDAARTEDIDNILRQTAEGLSQLGGQMQGAVVRLARRGDSGRMELNHHVAQWLVALKRMKAAVRKSVNDMTGCLLGSFSHSGMLIRAISDWSAELRQEYLRDFPVQEKAEAATLFDRTLLEVIEDSRSNWVKKSAPQAEGVISRLKLALQHAPEGSPPTPAEILAGARSVPKDIRCWAEREITRRAISAVLREGCHLGVGPLSLPVRVLPGGAQSGRDPFLGLSGGDCVINTALSKVAFRLTMSLSPTADMCAAGTYPDNPQGERPEGIGKAILDLPKVQAWTAGFVGARAGINAAVRMSIEQALAQEVAKFISETAVSAALVVKRTTPSAARDEASPRRRSKRAVDYQQAPSANVFYPVPERETAIDSRLAIKVKETLPLTDKGILPASEVIQVSSLTCLYRYNKALYLFIGGRYWQFEYTDINVTPLKGYIYADKQEKDEHNPSLPVYFNEENNRWCFLEDDYAQDDKHVNPGVNSFITTEASARLIEEAVSWPAHTAYTYLYMAHGKQGQIYFDGQKYSIYLHDKYWPVTLKGVNEAAIVLDETMPVTIYRDAESMVWEVKIEPGYKGGTAALLSDVRGWDVKGSYNMSLSEVPREGSFYKVSHGHLYIYFAGRFWPCKKLSADLCGVFVTAWGMKKVVIISDVNGRWDYADQTQVEKFNAFLDFQKSVGVSKLESAAKQKIHDCLTAINFVSWDDLINQIVTIVDTEFHKIYLHPENENLITIMMLRKMILDTQSVAKGILKGTAYESANLSWNQQLLSHYWEAFNIDITDVSILPTARYAHILADDAQDKCNKFKAFFEKEKKRLAEIDAHIAVLKRKIWDAENNPREYFSASLAMSYHVRYSQDFTPDLKKKEGEKNVVQTIINRMQKKRDAYNKIIQSYKKKYQGYEEGIALGDKTFIQRLELQKDKSDIITAAKEAVAELALKEVKLRQILRFDEGERERNQIDTLRIARATVRTILVQQQTYIELTQLLETINITIPDAAGTYIDIVWANKVTEEIYPKLFVEEDNPAAHDLLPAMLHWMQKNKKSVSHLKNLRAQEIIDAYAKSRHLLNPLTTEKDIPEGYVSLSELLDREYFSSKWDYNQQFIQYKSKYSCYEASERVRELLIISGFSLDEITATIKKRIRLNVRKKNNVRNIHAGELLFVQFKDNNWVFFSIFPHATFTRRFTDAQMQSNPWLQAIANLEPHKVHSHGLESVFTEAFFKKHFGRENEKIYWDGARRAAKEKEELIDNILYKKEGETEYPNPFEHAHFGGTEYNFYNHEKYPKDNLVVTLNISMKDALNRSANKLKADLYKPSVLHRIACLFIPFYSDINGFLTDDEYQPDGFALMADIFSVVCVATQAGTKISALIKNAKGIVTISREGGARGLTGKHLYRYMIREMGKQGIINTIELGKISINTVFDLVDALMLRDLTGYIVSKVRAAMIFHNIIPAKSAAQTIGEEFIRMNVALKDMQKQTLRGGEIYISFDPKTRSRVYYIETAKGVSEVRWSPATKAWRTVDPRDSGNPGQIMSLEGGEWVVAPDTKGVTVQPEMGIQPLRDNLPDKKISFNTLAATETEGVDAQVLLKELYTRNAIKLAMNNPTDRGKYLMAQVGNFMLEKGFENIRYRGIAIFVNRMDKMPTNHFVVIGTKNNRDYVFDLTAGNFSNKYDEFNGPVILPEELWAQKYANINGSSLIKYADYRSRAKAHKMFGVHSEYTSHGPQAIIPNAKVLRRPEWYYPDSFAAESIVGKNADGVKTMVPGPAAENKVMSSVRRSQWKTVTTDDATDYAVGIFENSELLNKETASLLRQSIKGTEREGAALTEASGLLETPRLMTSLEELLRLDKGEMLFFCKANAAVMTTPTQPFHVMVSVGNGRFAGINNSILDEALSNDPRILLAEQLGDFAGTQFKRSADGERVQIYAARPTGLLLADKVPLRDLASTIPAGTDSLSGLTDLLAKSAKLAPEQARALMRALQPVIENPAPVYGQLGAIEDVLTSPVSIKTEVEMMAVPEGHLVTFMRRGKSNAGHVMYSLGDGEFVIFNPARLDASLANKNTIIHASEIPAEVLRRNVVSAGEISLKKMRVSALLGSEGAFTVEGSTLAIKAMGGPGAVNSMDAQELADTIRGLARCESSAVDLSSISEINFYSHFGALGKVPVGKALAYFLDKKVTAYPVFYSPKLQGNDALLSEARTFLPEDLSADELAVLIKQQSRSHEFWEHTRSLFGDKGATESVEMSNELKELLLQVADYIRGKISIDSFLDGMTHFTNGLMIMKIALNLLYNHEETDFDGYVSLTCDVLGASRFGMELMIHFLER
ncbi:hypothetical protein [Kosakonia cowanii]|uniref:hypothetical protein n=1 Tax=Kosakonia cowanii TaxID=208223 RepID=UPI004063A5C4